MNWVWVFWVEVHYAYNIKLDSIHFFLCEYSFSSLKPLTGEPQSEFGKIESITRGLGASYGHSIRWDRSVHSPHGYGVCSAGDRPSAD